MDRARRRAAALLLAVAATTLLLDRVTKAWAERSLPDHPIDLIRGSLTLRFTTNSGGAFSLGQSAPWLFATASLTVSVLILATAFRSRKPAGALALGLILGGTLGNLTDRLTRGDGLAAGRVIDFIDLHWWPVFNLADSAIVMGALLFALGYARHRPEGMGVAASSEPTNKPKSDPSGSRRESLEGSDGR